MIRNLLYLSINCTEGFPVLTGDVAMSTLDSAANGNGPSRVPASLSPAPWPRRQISAPYSVAHASNGPSLRGIRGSCLHCISWWRSLLSADPSGMAPIPGIFVGSIVDRDDEPGSLAYSRHLSARTQAQSQLQFVWKGLCSVGLTFCFLLSAMFVLKVTTAYSRGTFFTQLIIVATAVALFRAIAFRWIQAAIADGRVEASRLAIIGDELNSAILEPLIQDGVQIVRTFPFPSHQAISRPENTDYNRNIARNIVADCRAGLR